MPAQASIVSPSFEARIVKVIPKTSSSSDGRATHYSPRPQEFGCERFKKNASG
jgi:hypothetical protein